MRPRFLSVGLCAAAVFCLCACGPSLPGAPPLLQTWAAHDMDGEFSAPAAYGRSALNEPGRGAYDAILAAALAGETEGTLPTPVSAPVFTAAANAVRADTPMLEALEITAAGSPVRVFTIYQPDQVQRLRRREAIREAAAPLLEDLPQDPVRRAALIHDRLLDHISYRKGAAQPVDGTVYGGLVNGIAVCNGFSRSFQYLCQQAGIPCYFIEGTSIRGIPHSWNMVLLNGDWLYVDATWNASSYPRCYHDYFLVSLEEMAREHFPSPDTPTLPPGNGKGYYELFGYAADSKSADLIDDMAAAFARQLRDFPPEAAGKTVLLEIKLTGKKYLEGRVAFQRSLFPMLVKINQEARRQNLPFAIETTGPVEYNFNDNTRVITIFPLAKRLNSQ